MASVEGTAMATEAAAGAAAAAAQAAQQHVAPAADGQQQQQQMVEEAAHPSGFDPTRYTLHSQGAEAVSFWPCWHRPAAVTCCPRPPPPSPAALHRCLLPARPLLLLQRVWEGSFLGLPTIVKQRFSKRYRHPSLDAKLTAQRLRQEARAVMRARKLGVLTPGVCRCLQGGDESMGVFSNSHCAS